MSMENVTSLSFQGLLPYEINNTPTLLSTCFVQAKKNRTSMNESTTGNYIRSENLRPGDKVSSDHYISY